MGVGFSTQLGKDSLLEETKQELDKVLQSIRSNDPDVVDLDLANKGLGSKGVEIGGGALVTNTNLKALNLSYNSITHLNTFMTHLGKNESLEVLNLSGNDLGETGAQSIAKCLEANKGLTELVLYQCGITDKALWHIANALQHNQTLSTLNLDRNPITAKGLKILVQCFRHNKTLSAVSLRVCDAEFPADLIAELNENLAKNGEAAQRRKQNQLVALQKAEKRSKKQEEQRSQKEAEVVAEKERVQDEYNRVELEALAEESKIQEVERDRGLKEERAARRQAAAEARKQQEVQKILDEAQEWKAKLGRGHREWRNGFTIMEVPKGAPLGSQPTIVTGPPRRLQACWCDPPDSTPPFAKTLHYHCKYEKEADGRGDDGESVKYEGCRNNPGHTCASVNFYAKPLPNETAANFFASAHPINST